MNIINISYKRIKHQEKLNALYLWLTFLIYVLTVF